MSFICCSETFLVDPTQEEEKLATGVITVVSLEDGNVCMLHKPGQYVVHQSNIYERPSSV